MKSTNEIQEAARRVLREAAVRCPQYADKLNSIRLRVSTRMTRCGGTANYRKNEIALSLPFLSDEGNFASELFEVVTHEAAHLIVGLEGRNGKPHGPQFKSVQRALGGTGKRTHQMDLADGFAPRRKAKRTAVACPCGCGQTMNLGPQQIKKWNRGERYYINGHQPRRPRMSDFFQF